MRITGLGWMAVAVGVFAGIGLFTFHYAEGFSYFKTDSRACLNCHIMGPWFDAWQKASHHTSATCVDCHLPQTFPAKYIAKSDNGYRHSKGFTFQDFHEPIVISKSGSKILQNNCVRCHRDMVHDIRPTEKDPSFQCVHCHATAGHGSRAGMGRYEHPSPQEESAP
jgi:cytochrome c nitrite reductase small subunit